MKAKEVLKLLKISRPTLTKYVKCGYIKVSILPTGRYDYDRKSIEKFLNKNYNKKIVIYGRVSNKKQKKDLEKQIEFLKTWCFNNGYELGGIYKDISSGISFKNRIELFEMIDDIIENKIKMVIITYKDRLSRTGFYLFKTLFKKYGVEIKVINEVGNTKLDTEEIFEEIITLLNSYSIKLYSQKRKNQIKEICKPMEK